MSECQSPEPSFASSFYDISVMEYICLAEMSIPSNFLRTFQVAGSLKAGLLCPGNQTVQILSPLGRMILLQKTSAVEAEK